MTEHAVVIAGGGPTGLMLAGELALAGVDVAIVERRAGQELAGWRAGGLHSRTIEVLDQRGIADRVLSQGQVFQVASFSHMSFAISDFPTRPNYVLGLRQERFAVVVTDDYARQTGEPSLRDLSQALVAVWGTDYGVHSPTWISRFTDMTRQAASYREGRVLLAGDAAHMHYPVGGQGLDTGVQDAVNLGWKLAQVVKGTSPESLLDTYHAERHPVAARVLRTTMAQTALTRSDARIDALRDTMAELLSMDELRERFAAMQAGLDIRYDL